MRVQNENIGHEANNRTKDMVETLDEDSIEFQLNEDMMAFLAQSMKHKIELKNQRESENSNYECISENMESTLIEGGQVWFQKRNEDAKLLYGEASSKILAMETALQTTVDRHKSKAKPQYWPNIPLKL